MQQKLPFLSFLSGQMALDNALALCDDKSEGWIRYGDLRRRLTDLLPLWAPPSADLLHPRGLILCAVPRTAQGAIAYLSAVASGHAILMIDPVATRMDLFIAAYEPDWILLPTAVRPGEAYTPADWPDENFYLWRRVRPSALRPHPDLFILLCPPGPPESIKTVRLSYANIACNLEASLAAVPLNAESRVLIHMPLAYSFALSLFHMVLCGGGKIVMSEHAIKSRDLWTLAQLRDVDVFAGVPFHYDYLARAGIDNLRVPRIKTFLQAGGKIPLERTQELLRQISARNGAFYILYGQTEAAPRMACLPLHERPDKIGSSGQAVASGRFLLEGERILYQGPNVMMGYAENRTDLALDDTFGDILPTGDLGFVDEEGFLFIEGKG